MSPQKMLTEPRHNFVRRSSFQRNEPRPVHVAIILDGNGRWASRRALPRHVGHREGSKAVRAVVERAADQAVGIGELTLYAFSSDNWSRPRDEVSRIMRLLHQYLRRETSRCVENDVRLLVVGRRDRLSRRLVGEIESAEAATRSCGGLTLRLAIDYSARDMLARAVSLAATRGGGQEQLGREDLRSLLAEASGQPEPVPDVDLLIRTGGDQRLSDFLLWECAYAELYFTPTLWPDFDAADLDDALTEFHGRQRRFGCVADDTVHALAAPMAQPGGPHR